MAILRPGQEQVHTVCSTAAQVGLALLCLAFQKGDAKSHASQATGCELAVLADPELHGHGLKGRMPAELLPNSNHQCRILSLATPPAYNDHIHCFAPSKRLSA